MIAANVTCAACEDVFETEAPIQIDLFEEHICGGCAEAREDEAREQRRSGFSLFDYD